MSLKLEFISASESPRHVTEFLCHMGDLQNIKFKKGQILNDILFELKEKNKNNDKEKAINDFIEINKGAINMPIEDVFMINDGFATFNFREGQ